MLAGTLWAAGLAACWSALPVLPRTAWQPPPGEYPLGFLADGRTLATAPTDGRTRTGPVRLWDVDTGAVRAAHFTAEDRFQVVTLQRHGGRDHLMLYERENPGEPPPFAFRMRLCDAESGVELARFTWKQPKENVWSVLTPDGKVTAFVTWEAGEPQTVWHDVESGRLLRRFPGYAERIGFSPDGRRFFAYKVRPAASPRTTTCTVWDVPEGREVLTFSQGFDRASLGGAKAFSPDGELLLDDHTQVWDLKTGKVRFAIPGIYYACSNFSRDGRWLIVEHRTKAESWVSWYDVVTGEERAEKRVHLLRGQALGRGLWTTPDGRYLLSSGSREQPSSLLDRGLSTLGRGRSDSRIVDHSFVLNAETGRRVTQNTLFAELTSPDGLLLLTHDREDRYRLWDLPPWPRLSWFLTLAAVLTLGLAAAVRYRWKRLPPVGQPSTAPPTGAGDQAGGLA